MSLFFRKSLQKNAEKEKEELELKNGELRDDYSEIGT
jgi:hypothetical protein